MKWKIVVLIIGAITLIVGGIYMNKQGITIQDLFGEILPSVSAQSWYNTSWGFKKNITINSSRIAENGLTNFPVLISITDSNLSQYAQADGDDILFTSDDGTTKLNHEIEFYNSTNGNLVAWVRIPSLINTSDTVIMMYYNNSAASNQQNRTGVWNSTYIAVWHLGDGDSTASGFYLDSTNNNRNGTLTDANGNTNQGIGQIGNAMNFFGDADYITTVDYTFTAGGWTLSAWINSSNLALQRILSKGSNPKIWFLANRGLSIGWFGGGEDVQGDSVSNVSDGRWTYVAGRVNSTRFQTYVNGSVDGSPGAHDGTPVTNSNPWLIGSIAGTSEFFNGTIDEVRISSKNLSNGWIKTEYNNQFSPSTFHTVGAEETSADTTSPQWSVNSTNGTAVNTWISHGVYWTDSALSGYIFEFDNATGSFANNSWVAMIGTTNWSNVTKGINSTVGLTIRWRVYSNDSVNNINSTSIFSYLTTSANTCTYTSGNWNVLFSDYCNITSNVQAGAGVNNVTITGTGEFRTTANITGFKNVNFLGAGSNNKVFCMNGGCFK